MVTIPEARQLLEQVDGLWWQRHADRIRIRSDQTLEYRTHAPLREVSLEQTTTKEPDPGAFGELVGQEDLVERLETEARGAKALGKPFPHTLLTGPAGTGKTTVAEAISRRVGSAIVRKNGVTLQDVGTLVRLLATLRDGDVLFLDEIHAAPAAVLEVLYEALDQGRISLTFRDGAMERCMVLTLARFTLVAATTQPADLPQRLHSRMQLREDLGSYETPALSVMGWALAERRGFALAAADRVASRSRGIRREVLRLTARAIVLAASLDQTTIPLDLAESMLRQQGFDDEGSRPLDRRYLETLRRQGGLLSLASLRDLLSVDGGTVLYEIEPELLARRLTQITARGGVAAVPGREAPRAPPPIKQASRARRTFAPQPRTGSVREEIPGGEA